MSPEEVQLRAVSVVTIKEAMAYWVSLNGQILKRAVRAQGKVFSLVDVPSDLAELVRRKLQPQQPVQQTQSGASQPHILASASSSALTMKQVSHAPTNHTFGDVIEPLSVSSAYTPLAQRLEQNAVNIAESSDVPNLKPDDVDHDSMVGGSTVISTSSLNH